MKNQDTLSFSKTADPVPFQSHKHASFTFAVNTTHFVSFTFAVYTTHLASYTFAVNTIHFASFTFAMYTIHCPARGSQA